MLEPAEPWALRWRGLASTHEPGFDLVGADIGFGELGEVDPDELDMAFDARDRFRRRRSRAQLFHEEHCVEFMMDPLAIMEALLGGEHERADLGIEPGFFLELSAQCFAGAFGEVDVPAGEVAVVVFDVSAHQDAPGVDEHASGNELGGGFGSHSPCYAHQSAQPSACKDAKRGKIG